MKDDGYSGMRFNICVMGKLFPLYSEQNLARIQ
jgi:hypothetical protein